MASTRCWESSSKRHQDPVAETSWTEVSAIETDIVPVTWAIGSLKDVFCNPSDSSGTDLCKVAQQKLDDVIFALQTLLRKHPNLCTVDLLTSVRDLLVKIKRGECSGYAHAGEFDSAMIKSINQLMFACSRCATESQSPRKRNQQLVKSRSMETLQLTSECELTSYKFHSSSVKGISGREKTPDEDIDQQLAQAHNGVDIALNIAYSWREYAQQMSAYIDQCTQLTADFAKSLLQKTLMFGFSSQTAMLDGQYGVFACLTHRNIAMAEKLVSLCDHLQETNASREIIARSEKHLRICDEIKAKWEKQQALVNDSYTDPLGCLPSSATNMTSIKIRIISELRQLISESEAIAKAVVVNYCTLINSTASDETLLMIKLCDALLKFEPGSYYRKQLKSAAGLDVDASFNGQLLEFKNKMFSDRPQSGGSVRSSKLQRNEAFYTDKAVKPSKCDDSQLPPTLSANAEKSNDWLDLSPVDSYKKSSTLLGGGIEMLYGTMLSPSAQSHKFLKALGLFMSCRQCSGNIYGHGVSCARCGLSCHKRCLPLLRWSCGGRLNSLESRLPRLIAKCIYEIEERGLDVKGIYRVSAVKSTVDSVCHQYDDDDSQVDLSTLPPHVVTGILKSYLRQHVLFNIPEQQKLSTEIQEELINIVQNEKKISVEYVITAIRHQLSRLPLTNFVICTQLIRHLKRVSDNSAVNQMTASNLSLVFGPTLLGGSSDPGVGVSATVMSLVADKCRVVELLILHADDLFGRGNHSGRMEEKSDDTEPLLTTSCSSSDSVI